MKSNFSRTIGTFVFMFVLSISVFAQGTLKGFIADASTGETLPGASITAADGLMGTITMMDGQFNLELPAGKYSVKFSYVGYLSQTRDVTLNEGQELDLGTIQLETSSIGIDEVMVIASVAIPRKTPVALSSIKPEIIEEQLGTQEFVQILNTTPGVYATAQGGGYGDSRINLRGFDQRNTAVMINGVPVNDMENGWVYWSNWAGLADVTRSMQVQRGLGASKIAVPSVGGTINVLTNTTDAETGGNVYTSVGNDGYLKTGVTISTGLSETGWATTLSLAKGSGDGYVDGTEYNSYSYFMNISKRLNDNHSFAFSVFGAPQWHNQRSYYQPVSAYLNSQSGIKYNSNWGYKNGEVLSMRKNFYHKPQAILNHFWTIDEKTSLSTAAYASIGTGGGTGPLGNGTIHMRDGQINWDQMVDDNMAFGNAGSQAIIRASRNDHEWYGAISTLTKELSDDLTLTAGLDGRYYIGRHFREVVDLLGGEYYFDDDDANDPLHIAKYGEKIDYHNDGNVGWIGAFGQLEYSKDNLSAFVSGSLSNQSFRRIDYFTYFSDETKEMLAADAGMDAQYQDLLGEKYYNRAMSQDQASAWQSFLGFGIKGGANYNIDNHHNVFVNAGYIQRQPNFDAVFLNYQNIINQDAVNEKIISFEVGYGFKHKLIQANINAYYTMWNDKTFTKSKTIFDATLGTEETFTANILGVDALHKGIELDLTATPTKNLTITAMASVGDWRWTNNVENVMVFNDEQEVVSGPETMYIKDIHVGDAAQTTTSLGVSYKLSDAIKIGANYRYFADLYAKFDPVDRLAVPDLDIVPEDAWKLPDYGLLNAYFRYNFEFAGLDASFIGNANNLLDEVYFSEALDGSTGLSGMVYYGLGRTWSATLKIRF